MSRNRPADPFEEIKQLYYNTTRTTVQRDLARAISLLKAMPDEETRARVAVYMDGLSQMRSEWAAAARPPGGRPAGRRGRSAQ